MGPEVEQDLRFSPDGGRLATLTGAGTIRLFATDDWHEIAQLAPPTGRFDAFAFSPDGLHLATLSTERGELVVWNAADATVARTFSGQGTAGGVPNMSAALAFSRDGTRIASSLGSIVDLTGSTVIPLGGVSGFVDQIAFTMCDDMVYLRVGSRTGDSNWTTSVFLDDAKTGQSHQLFSAWDIVFGGSALSQDGRLLAVANGYHPSSTATNDLSIYRGDTGELVDYRAVWRSGVIQAFTPDDTALFVAESTTLDQWRLADGAVVNSFWFGAGARLLGFPTSDAVAIATPTDTTSWSLNSRAQVLATQQRFSATAASWTGDGKAGAAVSSDGLLFHVWREPDATPLCTPVSPGPTAGATSFALSGDGSALAVGKSDGVVDVFDSVTGVRRTSIETAQGPVKAVQLSWDGTQAATQVAADAPAQVWSADGSLMGAVSLPAHPPTGSSSTSFALSPDARTVAISEKTESFNQTTATFSLATSQEFLDVATGAAVPVAAPGPWTQGSAFSPDSLHIAGWADGALATWRLADGVEDNVLVAPADVAPTGYATVPSIALSGDWSLAAALNGASLVVFDPRAGTELSKTPGFSPAGYADTVLGVAGETVAVSTFLVHVFPGDYFVTRLYDAPTGAELRAFPGSDGTRPLLLAGAGDRAFTLEAPDVIAWCR
jgi:WD40 repeat protein